MPTLSFAVVVRMNSLPDNGKPQTVNKKQAPWVALGIMLGFAGGVSFVLGPFCLPAIRRLSAPYVPANDMLRNRIIQACKKFEVKKMVDLGSGDGCLVIAAAKEGIQSTGYELNPWLCWYSKLAAYRQGAQLARFRCRNLWKTDTSEFDAIVFVGVPEMMPKLESKLGRNLICRVQ